MSSDNDVNCTGLQYSYNLLLFFIGPKTREHFDARRERTEPLRESLEVLVYQNSGGRKYSNLFPFHNCFEGGPHSHFGLTVTDVTNDQAIHRLRALHTLFDVFDCR